MQNTTHTTNSSETVTIETDIKGLQNIKFMSGKKYIVKLKPPVFRIQLEIDQDDPLTEDNSYVLFSNDNNNTYTCTLTPQDDQNQDNTCITLHYNDLKRDLHYTLKIDPGVHGDAYCLFEDMHYTDLVQVVVS